MQKTLKQLYKIEKLLLPKPPMFQKTTASIGRSRAPESGCHARNSYAHAPAFRRGRDRFRGRFSDPVVRGLGRTGLHQQRLRAQHRKIKPCARRRRRR